MDRPTDLLRRFLVVEALKDSMNHELAQIKKRMHEEGLKIIDRKDNTHDVWILYKCKNEFDEAIFMKKMLDAESKNRAKRTGMIT